MMKSSRPLTQAAPRMAKLLTAVFDSDVKWLRRHRYYWRCILRQPETRQRSCHTSVIAPGEI
jgi:hypothetical protein